MSRHFHFAVVRAQHHADQRIRRGNDADGIRGPILLKWIRQLLDDRHQCIGWLHELLAGTRAERIRTGRERNERAEA